jgi:peptide/nickel transport system permease protein
VSEAFIGGRAAPVALSPLRLAVWRLGADRTTLACLGVVLAITAAALLAPLVAPHDPADADLLRRLQPPGWMAGGDWAFPLGCDGLGRDLASRLVWGARISLGVGFVVVGASTAIGLLLGLVAGYARGITDAVLARLADVLLGFPYLVFAIGLMGMMGPGLGNIVLTLILKEWTVPFRIARGETLAASGQEYVEAARAIGCRPIRIMLGEMLPNVLSQVLVVASLRVAQVIIMEASLSFLGLGVQPPAASWGGMVADGRDYLADAWWVSVVPGAAILVLVLAINLGSQGLREAFDPRLNR